MSNRAAVTAAKPSGRPINHGSLEGEHLGNAGGVKAETVRFLDTMIRRQVAIPEPGELLDRDLAELQAAVAEDGGDIDAVGTKLGTSVALIRRRLGRRS